MAANKLNKCEWTVAKINELIDLWEAKACLYQTTNKDYHNRDMKAKACESLSRDLGVQGKLHAIIIRLPFISEIYALCLIIN